MAAPECGFSRISYVRAGRARQEEAPFFIERGGMGRPRQELGSIWLLLVKAGFAQ